MIETNHDNTFNMPTLGVEVLGNKFPSPLILGSGTLVEKFEEIQPYIDSGAGAVIPRSTRHKMERRLHPSPHLFQSGRRGDEMMLNSEWTGAAIEFWRPYLEEMSKSRQVIMGVSGRDIEGCTLVAKELDIYNFPLLEINISCAHSNSVHGFITRNADHISNLIKSIKDAGVQTPIAIKLGHSDFTVELASAAKDAGADAIVALNTYGPLLDFNINGGVPSSVVGIEGSKGGMSGAPLFNIALTDVAEIKKSINIPVIACGGVRKAEDVIKMIMAGADAVEIYTAAHVRGINSPKIFTDLNLKLLKYMRENGIMNLDKIKGLALSLLEQETNLIPKVPEVIASKCTGCNICIPVCLPFAINEVQGFNNKAGHIISIDSDACVGCGHCVSVCPSDALKIE